MKHTWLWIAVAAGFLGCAPANAQMMMAADMLPPHEIATIVRSMGLNPLERPRWRGGRYVMTATDRSGREVRVVVDAHSGQVIRVRPLDVGYGYDGPRGYGARPDPYDPRYAAPPPPPRAIPNDPRYAPQPQPGYEDDDQFDDDDGRTGSLGPIAPAPLRRITAPKVNTSPAARSAAITPQKTPDAKPPLPRPKPDAAQTAGKVAPPPVPEGEIRQIEIKKPDAATDAKAAEPKKEEPKSADEAPVVPLL